MPQLENVESYLDRLRMAIEGLPRERLALLGEMLYRAYRNEKQVFTLGNGGSASTASHMAAQLADVAVIIPPDDYGGVEDAHLMINHIIVDYFKARLAEDQPW